MANNPGFGGSSLKNDLEEIRVNDNIIEDYKKNCEIFGQSTS